MGNQISTAIENFSCLNPPDQHAKAFEVKVNNFTTRIPDNFNTALPDRHMLPADGGVCKATMPPYRGQQHQHQHQHQQQPPSSARGCDYGMPGPMQTQQTGTSWSPLAWLMGPSVDNRAEPQRRNSGPDMQNQQINGRLVERRRSEPPKNGRETSPRFEPRGNARSSEASTKNREQMPRGMQHPRDQERKPQQTQPPPQAQPDFGSFAPNTMGLTAENLRASRNARGSFAVGSEFGGHTGGRQDSFATNFALAGSFASKPPGGSFAMGAPLSMTGQQKGLVGCTTQPPQGVSTQLPGGNSFVLASTTQAPAGGNGFVVSSNTQPPSGCTTQPPMQGIATRLPPGMAIGKAASFAGSSIASQAGSFSHSGSFALHTGNAGMYAAPGRPGPGLQRIRE